MSGGRARYGRIGVLAAGGFARAGRPRCGTAAGDARRIRFRSDSGQSLKEKGCLSVEAFENAGLAS
ncbi:MAG: hypothetical protein HS116_09915 [Planctomycetes bacterium]|nr:hypothetical protein [Planctomycetota bacterium]